MSCDQRSSLCHPTNKNDLTALDQYMWPEAQLLPRDPRADLYQLKYWFAVGMTQQHSLRSTFSTCHVLFRYPQFCACTVALSTTIAQWACNDVRVINRLLYNQSWWCQLNRNCDNYHQCCWRHRALFSQRTIVDSMSTTVVDKHKSFK